MNNDIHINNIALAGRLARDPEIKELRPGLTVGKFTVATDFTYTNKDGSQMKESCFTEVVVWNKQAIRCGNSLRKGSLVAVEGRLKQDTWTDKKTGEERSKHVVAAESVVFMEPKTETTVVDAAEQFASDELPF